MKKTGGSEQANGALWIYHLSEFDVDGIVAK